MVVVTYSNKFNPAPTVNLGQPNASKTTQSAGDKDLRSKLLNLTGFFSSVAGAPGRPAAGEETVDIIWVLLSR